MFVETFISY